MFRLFSFCRNLLFPQPARQQDDDDASTSSHESDTWSKDVQAEEDDADSSFGSYDSSEQSLPNSSSDLNDSSKTISSVRKTRQIEPVENKFKADEELRSLVNASFMVSAKFRLMQAEASEIHSSDKLIENLASDQRYSIRTSLNDVKKIYKTATLSTFFVPEPQSTAVAASNAGGTVFEEGDEKENRANKNKRKMPDLPAKPKRPKPTATSIPPFSIKQEPPSDNEAVVSTSSTLLPFPRRPRVVWNRADIIPKTTMFGSRKKRKSSAKNAKKMAVNMSEEIELEDDRICAIGDILCKHPQLEMLNWVQCEFCSQWFHAICVDFDVDVILNDEPFACGKCKKKPKRNHKKP